MKKLKSLRFIQDGEYKVVGVYRESDRGGLSDVEEYSEVILDHGTDYYCIRATFKKLAKANNVEAFDLASEPLNESLAKMEQMK